MIVGTSLRYIRKEAGLSQAQVAESAGVTRAYYTQIENGQRVPRPQILKRLGSALGLSMDEIYSLLGTPTPTVPPSHDNKRGEKA